MTNASMSYLRVATNNLRSIINIANGLGRRVIVDQDVDAVVRLIATRGAENIYKVTAGGYAVTDIIGLYDILTDTIINIDVASIFCAINNANDTRMGDALRDALEAIRSITYISAGDERIEIESVMAKCMASLNDQINGILNIKNSEVCVGRLFNLNLLHYIIHGTTDELSMPLHVIVNKGRKWKGEGYLIKIRQSVYHYSPYSSAVSVIGTVYCPETKELHDINIDNMILADDEASMLIGHIMNRINKVFAADNGITSHSTSYTNIYHDNTVDSCFYPFRFCNNVVTDCIEDAMCTYVGVGKNNGIYEAINDIDNAKMQAEIQKIMKWVLANTEKTGADAEALAKHIYDKNHKK